MTRKKFPGINLERIPQENAGRAAIRRILEIDERTKKEKLSLLASLKWERRKILTAIRRLHGRLARMDVTPIRGIDRKPQPTSGIFQNESQVRLNSSPITKRKTMVDCDQARSAIKALNEPQA